MFELKFVEERITMRKKIIEIIAAILLLIIGGLIYLTFRTKSLVMFSWVEAIRLDGFVDALRENKTTFKIPYFIKYCLPNALWTLSYILMVDAIIRKDNNKLFWTIVLPIIASVLEIFQIWKIIPGTFDIADLLCFLLPTISYCVYYKIYYNEKVS